jgi:uncharacterized protein (UPF0297 family)
MMKTIDNIRELLEKRGVNPTDSCIGRIMGVHPATIARWNSREQIPWKHRTNLEMLERILKRAQKDTRAAKIAESLVNPVGAGLLRLGIKGILIASGLGWVTED